MYKKLKYYIKNPNKNCLLLGSPEPGSKQVECTATYRESCKNCPFFTSKKEWKKEKKMDWLTGYMSYYTKRKEGE